LRSARWLYAFVLIPFHCFQQRKMRPFHCQRKLTHTGADCGADPHRDPHGEMSGRKQWSKRAATSSFLDKKPPKSLVQQGLEGSTAVGKDEVGGSNPPSSSKKPCFLSKAGLFLYFLTNLICGSGWQRRPEDVFHCPPKIVWPTRSCCLIFVSNLASTITQQQKRALFVEAVTLVTWTKQQEENSCIPQNTLSAFST